MTDDPTDALMPIAETVALMEHGTSGTPRRVVVLNSEHGCPEISGFFPAEYPAPLRVPAQKDRPEFILVAINERALFYEAQVGTKDAAVTEELHAIIDAGTDAEPGTESDAAATDEAAESPADGSETPRADRDTR